MLGRLFMLLLLTVPAVAQAHPGHGHVPADSLLHYVVEPVHAVVLVLAVALGALVLTRRDHSP